MYATDLSAVLPPHERQIYDSLTLKAVQILRDQQAAQAAALARKKPVGDRMMIRAGD